MCTDASRRVSSFLRKFSREQDASGSLRSQLADQSKVSETQVAAVVGQEDVAADDARPRHHRRRPVVVEEPIDEPVIRVAIITSNLSETI